jgi:hypothetical protein
MPAIFKRSRLHLFLSFDPYIYFFRVHFEQKPKGVVRHDQDDFLFYLLLIMLLLCSYDSMVQQQYKGDVQNYGFHVRFLPFVLSGFADSFFLRFYYYILTCNFAGSDNNNMDEILKIMDDCAHFAGKE